MTKETFNSEVLEQVKVNPLSTLLEKAQVQRTAILTSLIPTVQIKEPYIDLLFLSALYTQINFVSHRESAVLEQCSPNFIDRLTRWNNRGVELINALNKTKTSGNRLKDLITNLGYLR